MQNNVKTAMHNQYTRRIHITRELQQLTKDDNLVFAWNSTTHKTFQIPKPIIWKHNWIACMFTLKALYQHNIAAKNRNPDV